MLTPYRFRSFIVFVLQWASMFPLSIFIFISVLRPCKSLSYFVHMFKLRLLMRPFKSLSWCVHLFRVRLLMHFAHFWCALVSDFLKHFGVSFACRLRQAFAVVTKGHNLRCLCSTSPSGGNQVDGLPPASSFEYVRHQNLKV